MNDPSEILRNMIRIKYDYLWRIIGRRNIVGDRILLYRINNIVRYDYK